jgi:hypothetical protein
MADLDYRPTEMALGLAAEELFAALPTAYQEQLCDLPLIVKRLGAQAESARARVDELSALMAMGGPQDLSAPHSFGAAHEAAKRALGESVAALESVRLDLLRLHGGAGDLKPITTVLEAARELGDELARLYDAQREVNGVRTRSSLDVTPPTPA